MPYDAPGTEKQRFAACHPGRLVEQRPEEGTAGELFAQIQEEKQRLVQEGKIKANKKIEPISDDTIPFDIPDSWVWIRFG